MFLVSLILICWLTTGVFAADEQSVGPYSGNILSRSTLTGDWGGLRNTLAAKGVTFDSNLVVTGQGVVDGGINHDWEVGGRGGILFKADTGKLGLWPGGFLTVELEGNFGKAVNLKNGGLAAINTNQIFPMPGNQELNLPALNFTQFLSEYVGVAFGKMDTSSGDMNEFAHGKGDSQFMNLAFNLNPALMMAVPYSTLGTGLVILPAKDPNAAIITLSVLSANGKANTSGFEDLSGDKLTYNVEGRVRTNFFGLTGHQLVGGLYSNKNFTSIDQRLTLMPGSNSIAEKTDSWAVYYNFDQFLYETVKGSGKGFGIFGRFAATDGNPNPINYFYSLGFASLGAIASRPHDRFGFGWYYMDVRNPTLTGPLTTRTYLRNEHGFELYYSAALTPWAHLTPNMQFIHGAQETTDTVVNNVRRYVDTATIMGLRMQLLF